MWVEVPRIFPPNNSKNDKNFGVRIDRGPALNDDSNKIKVFLQINKEGKDPVLKEFIRKAKRGTRTNVAEAIVDTTKSSETKSG